jgi:3-deoxy-D-arabino-heptulosonate 7-phosphate (DAHP) synthase
MTKSPSSSALEKASKALQRIDFNEAAKAFRGQDMVVGGPCSLAGFLMMVRNAKSVKVIDGSK